MVVIGLNGSKMTVYSGRKKENVEFTGITDDIREIQTSKS